jgi:hemolysin activation/secretion protein
LPNDERHFPSSGRLLLLLGVMLAAAAPAAAQTARPTLPGSVQPGRETQPLPQLPSENEFDFSIQQPGRSPVPRAAEELVFTLHGINVVGATVYKAEDLRAFYADLLEHDIKLADIQNVADAIENKYHQDGYALTRVFVPPQRVGNGIFTISVVEGFVKAIDVEGDAPGNQALIKAYLQPVLADRPLRLSTMERALLLANDIPGIAASGLLRPSPDEPGASDLVVTVTPTPYAGSAGLDNRGSNFAGPWTVRGDAAANGLIGANDQLYVNVSSVPNSLAKIEAQIRYLRLVGSDGMAVSFNANGSYGEPGSTLTPLELVTSSYGFGPRAHYPLRRARAESIYLDGGFTWNNATVTSLGQPFSHDEWRVADVAVSYVQNGFLAGTTAVTLGISQGLPIFGARSNGALDQSRPGAHNDFTKLTGSLRRGQAIYGGFNLAFSTQWQYAFAPLVTGEQIAFGGDTIGRGYDPSVLEGDQGIGASLELRYDYRLNDSFVESVQPYAFFDAAEVWNWSGGVTGGNSLSSAGGGVRFGLPYNISAGIEYAQQFSHLANNDNGHIGGRVLFNAAMRF